MAKQNRDLSGIHVFGIVLCGFLLGTIVAGPLMARLEFVPSGEKTSQMSFESLASIMLGVAAIVVGVVLPLAGIFAFGFLRNDVKHKTEDFISDDILKGRIHTRLEEAILATRNLVVDETRSTFADEQGLVRQYISASVKEAFETLRAEAQINDQNKILTDKKEEWGFEADEYGDKPTSKGLKK
jgi:hypothetical protein